jgi:hypothetical protein
VIERNFFDELQRTILDDNVLDYTIAEFARRIREREHQFSDEVSRMQDRKQEIEQQLARLAASIADTGHSRFVVEAMAERERELDQLTQSLQTNPRGDVEQHVGNIREFVTTRLSDLVGLLSVNPSRARAELAKHTTEIRMIPEKGSDGRLYYVAEGGWDPLVPSDFGMVAGDGFEPPTFGL